MKKLMSIFLASVLAAGMLPFNVSAAGENVVASWFGNEENDYTEGFEDQTEWSLPTSFQGSSQVGNIEGRRITGEKYLAVERPSSGDPAVSYADKSDNAISEGTACISFGVRVRKASTDFSISFAETDAVLDGLDHISDNVFQVRNNGANFDLYIDETRVCALTTGGNIGSGDMSDIVRISAAIDFDQQLLRVRADRINSEGITVETKTTDAQLDNVNDLAGVQMVSKNTYSGAAVDDIRVVSTDESIDSVIAPPQEEEPTENEIYVDESFDSLSYGNGAYIVKQTGTTAQSKTENAITYKVGYRDKGGDNETGIIMQANGSDKYITAVSGRFSSSNRHPYIVFDGVKPFEDAGDKAFMVDLDFRLDSSNSAAVIDVSDGSSKIMSFKMVSGIMNISNGSSWNAVEGTSVGAWYRIKLVFNQNTDKYTVSVYSDGILIYSAEHDFITPGAAAFSRIDFGNSSSADMGNIVSINNLKIYTGNSSPVITEDTTDNYFGVGTEYTFADDAQWREAVTSVSIGDEQVQEGDYVLGEGTLAINGSLFPTAGYYNIVIRADGYPDVTIIQSICAEISDYNRFEDLKVKEGTRLEDVMAMLPLTAETEIADGTSVTVELVWSEQSVPEYDMTKADTYTFIAKAKGLPAYISNAAEFEFEQNVIVEIPEDRTIASAEEIADAQYNVSNNIATVEQIEEKLQKTVEITLDDESVYKADVIWTCVNADSGAEASEGSYVFHGEYAGLPSYIKNENSIFPTAKVDMVTAAAVRVSESLITDNSLKSAIFDSSFGNDNLVTYKGWQYAVYYTTEQHPAISRRKSDTDDWETVVFTDYTRTAAEDGHYVIVMGICAEDGTIHMAWDGWNSELKYRISIPGIANDLENAVWSMESFSGVLNTLNGLELPKERDENYGFGYPRFLMIPTTGKLQFETRLGYSGNSDNYLFEYDKDGWTNVGRIACGIQGEPVNEYTNTFYIHGIDYDNNGRMHITWSWRERARTGITDLETCHDLNYVYSDDYGRTFYNSDGKMIAEAGTNPITQKTEGIIVANIPRKSGIVNQEGQAVDSQGRIHVVIRHYENLTAGGPTYRMHYWRDTDGVWHSNKIVQTDVWNRGKIFFDSKDRAYYIFDNAYIYTASPETQWTDWTLLSAEDKGKIGAEPLIDKYALKTSDKLYIFAPNCAGAETLSVIRYDLNYGKTINEIKAEATAAGADASYLTDDNYMTYWEADTPGTQMIELDLGGEKEVDTVIMREAFGRVSSFSIEYNSNGSWKKAAEGDGIGQVRNVEFAPVLTDKIRITLEADEEKAALFDIKLYRSTYEEVTEPEPETLFEIESVIADENSIRGKVVLNTNDDAIKAGTMIVAFYAEDGTLEELKICGASEAGEFEVKAGNIRSIKAMVVDNTENIRPLIKAAGYKVE